jgi:hypothetical protein
MSSSCEAFAVVGLFWCSYWIPGSYAAIWPKALHSTLRLLKNKDFEEERMTKIGWRAFVNSTTLESNKSPGL